MHKGGPLNKVLINTKEAILIVEKRKKSRKIQAIIDCHIVSSSICAPYDKCTMWLILRKVNFQFSWNICQFVILRNRKASLKIYSKYQQLGCVKITNLASKTVIVFLFPFFKLQNKLLSIITWLVALLSVPKLSSANMRWTEEVAGLVSFTTDKGSIDPKSDWTVLVWIHVFHFLLFMCIF